MYTWKVPGPHNLRVVVNSIAGGFVARITYVFP
jgi:hypothetical protein